MFNRLTIAIMVLIAAMLIGLVGHGVELFYNVEGGGFYGFIKALGFPLAFEVGNAIGLYVGFNRKTKGLSTRLVALLIGAACIGTSYLIQFHYFKLKIDADWWYSGVLPGLVALLSALAGLLDRDLAKEEVKPVAQQPQQPVMDFASAADRITAMHRQDNEELWVATQATNKRLDKIEQMIAALKPAPQQAPVAIAQLAGSAKVEENKQAQIRQMREQNKTWDEIAAHFGVAKRTVQNWAKEV